MKFVGQIVITGYEWRCCSTKQSQEDLLSGKVERLKGAMFDRLGRLPSSKLPKSFNLFGYKISWTKLR